MRRGGPADAGATRWREASSTCSWHHQGSTRSGVVRLDDPWNNWSNLSSDHHGLRRLETVMCTRLDRIEAMQMELMKHCQAEQAPSSGTSDCGSGFTTRARAAESSWQTAKLEEPCISPSERPYTPMLLRREWRRFGCDDPSDPEAVAVKASRVLQMTRDEAVRQHFTPQKSWWVLLPSTKFRVFWDVLMMLIIAHDLAVVPVTLAFNTGENIVSKWLFYPTLIYWTFDLVLSFFTGFYKQGQTVVAMAEIACNYMRTWFFVDIFVLCASWMEVWLSFHTVDTYLLGRAGKTLRVLRILRAIRILRLAKIQRVAREFEDQVASEYVRISIQVLKLILTIMWLNHFVACMWWAIGISLKDDGEIGWTTDYEGDTLGQQYFTSLHWSLTQFTPASMDVSAKSLAERVFSVAVLLFAMVTFSSFVSSVTAATTQLRELTDYRDANFAILRRYLHGHKVPMDLAIRILHCVEYRLGKQKSEIPESQVDFLGLLSKPLQMELSLHLFAPLLTRHPFLHRYSLVDSVSMRRVCIEAVTQVALYMEDLLFTEGSVCEQMFFVVNGLLHYTQRRERESTRKEQFSSASWDDSVDAVMEGGWCCEICLWSPWVHRGTMVATQMCEVVAVRVAAFSEITSAFPLISKLTIRYAALFVENINEALSEGESLSDMSAFPQEMLEQMTERAYMAPRKTLDVGTGGLIKRQFESAAKTPPNPFPLGDARPQTPRNFYGSEQSFFEAGGKRSPDSPYLSEDFCI